MSLVTMAHVCSHLQNASRARLAITSVPSSNSILRLTLALQSAGFLSSVTRGGPQPPTFLTATSHPAATNDADAAEAIITQENIASRRLWLGLKYWNNEPVLHSARLVSKPKARITLRVSDLLAIVRGRSSNFVKGLENPGECLFLSTHLGILEARECIEKGVGGMALCRVL